MRDPFTFRPKKKIGQIYINIPGGGSFSVDAGGDPHNLDSALKAAADAFWNEYKRLRGLTTGEAGGRQDA